jgi:hypothetical protein
MRFSWCAYFRGHFNRASEEMVGLIVELAESCSEIAIEALLMDDPQGAQHEENARRRLSLAPDGIQ